jgi:CRISPR/Cas system endoribonuclease Cas6 (RAMP superfamily)
LSALSYFHVGRSLDLDFTGLIERARQVQLADASFRWVDLERYSGRQKRPMTLGGIVGEATYAGDLGEFLPFLRLGEQVHVGKASSFGFGRYELLAPPAASP